MSPYKKPGVYISEVTQGGLIRLPSGAKIPAIVAPASDYTVVSNVAITKGSAGGQDTIPDLTANDGVKEIVKIGDVPDHDKYILTTDYLLAYNSTISKYGKIDWSPGGSEPTAGETYYVTYKKYKVTGTNSDYYDKANTYYSIDEVRSAYGDELNYGVMNRMTAGAKLMFQNGAPAIIAVQPTSASNTHMQTAIDVLKTEDVDVVVAPGCTNSTLVAYLRSHVIEQSATSQRHERMAIVSMTGLTDTVSSMRNQAISLKSERVVDMAPSSCTVTLHDADYDADQTLLVSGDYLGCALAGFLCNPNYDVAEPVTRKQLVGINDLSTHNYKETEMNNLASDGVCVAVYDNGVVRIRHGITTDTSNANTNSISVVNIKDNIKKTIRDLLDEQYIGTKILTSTPASMTATIKAFLQDKINNTIITAYRNINVEQNSSEPRQIDVRFEVSVVYPLEWISIDFSLWS